MQLTLTEVETGMLAEILASYRSDLRMEIADTDSMDFREQLKQREGISRQSSEPVAGGATGVCVAGLAIVSEQISPMFHMYADTI